MAKNFGRLVATEKDPIDAAVRRALGSPPTRAERAMMNKFLNEQIASYNGNKEAALIDFCHALLASNEMIYVE